MAMGLIQRSFCGGVLILVIIADSYTYGDDADGLPLDPPLDRGSAEGRNEEPAVIDRDASG